MGVFLPIILVQLFIGTNPTIDQSQSPSTSLNGTLDISNSTPCRGEPFTISYSDECTNTCCEFTISYSISGNRIQLVGDKKPEGPFCNFVITPYTLDFVIDESNLSGTYSIFYNGDDQGLSVTVGGINSLSINGEREVEAESSIELDATFSGGSSPYNYNWQVSNFGGSATISPNNDQATLNALTAGDVLVSLTVTDNNGCQMEQSEQITITPKIVCTVAGGTISTTENTTDLIICAGDGTVDLVDVTLSGNVGTSSFWIITGSSGQILSKPDNFPVNLDDIGSGVFYIQHLSADGDISNFLDVGDNIADIEGCFDFSNRITITSFTGDDCLVDCNRAADSLILVNLYNQLDGPNWTYDDNAFNNGTLAVPIPNAGNPWNLNEPIDTWHGVQTNDRGCVVGLVLRSNGLSGVLPTEVGNLSALTNLMLNINEISGPIPKELGNLTELEILRLFDNQFSGPIPPEIGNLSKLNRLTLESNQLTGTIPAELGNLTNLEIIRLKNNELTGTIPLSFAQLTNLERLIISGNQLSGNIPEELGSLTKITRLYLDNNQFSGCFPESLRRFCSLGFSNDDQNQGYNFTNNPLLPWQGDFDRFCNNEDQVGASCDDGNTETTDDKILTDCSCGNLVANIDQTMVFIHGGAIDMGCTSEQDANCSLPDAVDEVPVHEVKVPAFYLGQYEVKQSDWEKVMGDNPAFFGPANSDGRQCASDCPIENITWFGAIVYCNRLSEMAGLTPCYYSNGAFSEVYGKTNGGWSIPNTTSVFWNGNADGYRLPTEAEWEFAAKGGNYSPKFIYSGSNNIDDVAVYGLDFGTGSPSPVGSKSPNVLNIYDMSGNVEEWVWDFYADNYYSSSPRCYPTGPGNGSLRVRRGGGWGADPQFCRVTDRNGRSMQSDISVLGFRIARNVDNMDYAGCTNICTTHPDYDAMRNFYESTNGANWTNTSGWFKGSSDDNCDPCSWEGVTCNNEGRVIKIELPNYNLTGSIPNALTELPFLNELDLSDNNLTGPIPNALFTNNNLTHLNLNNNNITSNLPVSIATASNLISLELGNNTLDGALPEGIGSLSNLTTIDLSNNQFSDCFPTSFQSLCGQLLVYDFSNNPELLPNGGDFDLYCSIGALACCKDFEVNATANETTCIGTSDGSILLMVSNGIGPYTYNWDNGSATDSGTGLEIQDLSAGTYSVSIVDTETSCSAIIEAIIDNAPEIILTCAEQSAVSMQGGSDGIGQVEINNGQEPYTISWTGPSSGSIDTGIQGINPIPNLSMGTYSVTVMDVNGCQQSCSFTINEPNCLLSVSGVATAPNCNGEPNGSIELTPENGTGPYSYEWTNENNQSTGNGSGLLIQDLEAGAYRIVLNDLSDGCVVNTTITVNEGAIISLTCEEQSAVSMQGGSDGIGQVEINNGQVPYTISWIGPSSGSIDNGVQGINPIPNLSMGTYSVTVEDVNGCQQSCSFTINEPNCLLSVSGMATAPNCNGESNGSIELTPENGTGPYSYEWTNENNQSTGNGSGLLIQDLEAGAYRIVLNDSSDGCVANTTIAVNEGTIISLTCNQTNPVSTLGGNDGTGQIMISGGEGPFQINWSGAAMGSISDGTIGRNIISDLIEGRYTIEVVDANNCSNSCDLQISGPDCNLSAEANITVPSCLNSDDGSLELIPTGGVGPFSYTWSDGNNTGEGEGLQIANLIAGTYDITLTDDSNSCFTLVEATLRNGNSILISCNESKPVTIIGGNDGEAVIEISGGTETYTIDWSGPVTGNFGNVRNGSTLIPDLQSGSYSVVVTDAKGCTERCSFTISSPDCIGFTTNASAFPPKCSGGNDGSVTLLPAIEAGTFQYEWNNQRATGSGDGLQVDNLESGNYAFTLTNTENGCTATTTAFLQDGEEIQINCKVIQEVSILSNDGIVSIEVQNGQPPFYMEWSGGASGSIDNGALGSNEVTGLVEGDYNVLLRDANQCTQVCNFSLKRAEDPCAENGVAAPEVEQTKYEYCEGTDVPTLQVIPETGFQYNWYDLRGQDLGNNKNSFQPSAPGAYFVEAERLSDGCKSQRLTEIEVMQNQNPTIDLDEVVCNSEELGTYIASLIIQNAAEVSFSEGEFRNNGNIYTVRNVPINSDLEVLATNRKGCTARERFSPPNCDCPDLDPPNIENVEVLFCPSDEVPALVANVPQGLSVNWYDDPSGGTPLAESNLSYQPSEQGIYFAETIDASNGCKSVARTRVLVFELNEPFIQDIDKFCDADFETYTLIIEATDADRITASAGDLSNTRENLFIVENIPISISTTIEALKQGTGCTTQFLATPPECTCDTLPAPELTLTKSIETYCSNKELPEITVSTVDNTTVNWYDSPQGGNLVARFKNIFKPSTPGKYYGETVSIDGRCVSQDRIGVHIKKLAVSIIEDAQTTCLIDEIRSDTTFLEATNGCDSLVVTKYTMDQMPEEIFDTLFVCTVEEEGIASSFETIENCTVIRKTTKIFNDFLALANAGNDETFCEPTESIQLFAELPNGTLGRWISLDGAPVENENTPETIASITNGGFNRFVWVLSTESCEDVGRDTVKFWVPPTFSALDDGYSLDQDEPLNNANLLANDDLPERFVFTPFGFPDDEPLTFNQDNGILDGTFSYNTGSEPTSFSFMYKICDTECVDLCDTAEVLINVDCIVGSDREIPNGFDPYLGEIFDPLSYLINDKCNQTVLFEESTLEIYDHTGTLVFKEAPYRPWDGKSTKGMYILPIDNYYWKLTLKNNDTQSGEIITRVGSILLFHE